MKTFVDYLVESVQSYCYRVKVAGDMPEEAMDHLEASLEKWSLESISKPKTTPIQEHPLDFPSLSNIEVHIFDIETGYPATIAELQSCIAKCLGASESHVLVVDPEHPEVERRDEETEEEDKPYKPLLGSDYEKEKHEIEYGDKFNKKFLKDQETRKYKIAGGKTPKAKMLDKEPQGNLSPIGSTKRKS